jgi:O-antigen/teichoic acid export membrane protein
VLLGMVITPVIAIGLAAWQTARAARELAPDGPGARPDPALVRRFAGFAGMSFLTQLTNWFYDVAFVVFVLAALGLSLQEVALLSFAYTFAKSNLGYAYLPFGGLLTPLLTRIRGRGDPAALQETYGSMTRLFALILIPAGIGLALLTPRLLALLYPRYTTTADLAYVLIAFTFLESILSVPHNVLMVYDRYRPLLVARLLALISVPLLALLVPRYGVIGAAVAVGVARVLPRVVTLIAVRRSMGLRFPLRFAARVLAATLAFGVPLLLLLPAWPLPPDAKDLAGKAAAAVGLGALAALSALGYLLALRLLGGLDEQERKRILSLKLPFKNTLARLL